MALLNLGFDPVKPFWTSGLQDYGKHFLLLEVTECVDICPISPGTQTLTPMSVSTRFWEGAKSEEEAEAEKGEITGSGMHSQ